MRHLNEKTAIIVTDSDRFIIWVNDVFTKMTGYSFGEVRGKKPSLLQGKNSEKAAIKRIRQSLEEEVSFHDRITNYRKNGEEYTCALTIHPIFNTTGLLTNFIAFEVDNNFVSISSSPLMQLSEKYHSSNLNESTELDIFFRLLDYFRENKPLFNFKSRALINYLLVLALFLSHLCPFLSETSIIFVKIIGFFILLLTITTNFKYALFKIFSIRTTRHVGVLLGFFLMITPIFFIYRLEIFEISYFLSLGIVLILLDILTDDRTYNKKYTLL